MPGKKILMSLGVKDISGVLGVVSLGISGVFTPGVHGNVALGIIVVVASIFPVVVYLGYSIFVPGKFLS